MTRRLLVALLVAGAACAPAASASMPEKLQPGIFLETSTGGCTANFVYDGLESAYGRVFLGTAAHCVGQRGEAVKSGGDVIGKVAALGSATATETDWALVEIDAGLHSRVDAALVGHPDMPMGEPLLPGQAAEGDTVQFDGWGQGFDQTAQTREGRTGELNIFEPKQVRVTGPVSTGDSGGPIVHVDTRRPLASITSLQGYLISDNDGLRYSTGNGPTVVQILALARAAGVPVRLRSIDSLPVPAPQSAAAEAPASPAIAPVFPAAPAATATTRPATSSKKTAACRARARRIKKPAKRRAALRRCTRLASRR